MVTVGTCIHTPALRMVSADPHLSLGSLQDTSAWRASVWSWTGLRDLFWETGMWETWNSFCRLGTGQVDSLGRLGTVSRVDFTRRSSWSAFL